ncbi:MAG: glycoside hydrolase family 73 protein [Chitinophagales bacterium]
MKNILFSITLLLICSFSHLYAQKKSKKNRKKQINVSQYLNQYRAIAITESKRTQVPASITLAQGILESAYGNSYLARKGRNHFGIKCHKQWKSKRIFARGSKSCYRKYKSAYSSYIDHSNFLRNNKRYKSLFDLDIVNYQDWAKGLKEAGYATDPLYPKKLIQIIEKHNLHEFDEENYFAKGGNCEVEVLSTTFSFNGLKMVVFDCPIPPKRIAQAYDISLEDLLKYNPFNKDEEVPSNTVVFLEPLKKRGPKGIPKHLVTTNETVESIAHLYGVKSDNLYHRNRIEEGEKPPIGSFLYLRKKAPQM